jgi:hypothetical protein
MSDHSKIYGKHFDNKEPLNVAGGFSSASLMSNSTSDKIFESIYSNFNTFLIESLDSNYKGKSKKF